jgi:rhomboid family GlyGly-CTERM serine protease
MRQISAAILKSPITLVVTVLAIVIGQSDSLTSLLDFHRHEQFAVLKLLTCHLTHWSSEHLFWDVSMFVALGVICERAAAKAYYATLLGSALFVPLSVMLSNPAIDVYRGLSGIDTGIFALFASISLSKSLKVSDKGSIVVFGAMLVLLWCKIGFEFWSGGVLFVKQVNFEPVPVAHAVGALLGSTIAVGAHLQSLRIEAVSPYQ